jgi:pyruvate/oxaloacetate carboxyltransferase
MGELIARRAAGSVRESQSAHDPEFYVGTLQKILDAGIPFDAVCFKDALGDRCALQG